MKTKLLIFFALFSLFAFSCRMPDSSDPVTPDLVDEDDVDEDDLIGSLYGSHSAMFVSQSSEIIFTIEVLFAADEVALYVVDSENGENPVQLTSMYDNGDLTNGDDIMGDSIYSGKYTFNESSTGSMYLMAKATSTVKNEESSVITLLIVTEPTTVQLTQLQSGQSQGSTDLENNLATMSLGDALDATSSYMSGQPGVVSSDVQGSFVKILYDSGIVGVLTSFEDGLEGPSGSERSDKTSYILDDWNIGDTAAVFDSEQFTFSRSASIEAIADDEDTVGSRHIMLWAPWESQFSGWNTEFLDPWLNDLITDSESPNYDVTYLLNAECTVASIRNWTNYGGIFLHTHGGFLDNEVVFSTGEVVNSTNLEEYKLDLASNDIYFLTVQGESRYIVTPSFIENLSGEFPRSVIYNGSCESAHNNTMANAFIGKGADVYFGFNESVTGRFDSEMAHDIFPDLIDGDTVGEIFTAGQTDPYHSNAAEFIMISENDDLKFASHLINGSFEQLKNGWFAEGDGRVISSLGSADPTDDDYMAIVSTGLGFTTSSGKLYQSFTMPNDVSFISFDLKFYSEEWPEWYSTAYQDTFAVYLILEDGSIRSLLSETIDSIYDDKYDSGDLIDSDISFDQGGVMMTEWISYSTSITDLGGEAVTLVFEVGDVGDSIYDSSMLIDYVDVE